LSAREFGAKARVDFRSLHWWSWALGKRATQKSEPTTFAEDAPAFLPVRIVQRDAPPDKVTPLAGEPVEIIVDARLAVRVGPGFDEATLRRVLEVLCDSELA
jgi:hypothetical protein